MGNLDRMSGKELYDLRKTVKRERDMLHQERMKHEQLTEERALLDMLKRAVSSLERIAVALEVRNGS